MRVVGRWLTGWVATAWLVTSCAAPGPVQVGGHDAVTPTLSLDAMTMVDRLADKPTRNWQDGTFTYPPLMKRLQEKAAGYRTQALTGSITGSNNLGTASTNAPAYTKDNVDFAGPNPAPKDRLYVLSDNGQLRIYDPANLAGGPIGTKTLPGAFTNSAVVVSGDNARVYALSTSGNLVIASTTSPYNILYNQRISATGFTGGAPFIDYSVPQPPNTKFGSYETLYCVSNDGSIYRAAIAGDDAVANVTVNAFPSSNGTDKGSPQASWATNMQVPYGAAVSAASFPLAWQGRVYFGTAAGTFYRVNVSGAPAVSSWNLAGNTSASGTARSITAPPALDFDNNFAVDKAFVACGDRLHWVDLVSGRVASSPSLTLDRLPSVAPTYAAFGALSGYGPQTTTVKQYTLDDWISAQKLGTGTLTRWSGPAQPAVSSTGVVAVSVRVAPNGEIWCTDQSASKVFRYDQNGVALPTSATAPVNPINLPNGAGKGPIKLEFDSQGNCWVTSGQIPAGGFLSKIKPDGTLAFPTITNAGHMYLAVDKFDNCWTVDFNAQKVYKFNASGVLQAGFPVSLAGATTIYCDPTTGAAWVTTFGSGGNKVYKVAQNGTSSTYTVGTAPIGVDFDPLTGNVWVTNNGSSNISVLNPNTGALIQTIATSANPWAIRFESDGTPWISNMNYFAANPTTVSRLNRAGAVQAGPYTLGGRPFEMCFDNAGTCWVATDGGLYKILDIGDITDLFGSSYRVSAGDGNDSFAYMRFKIPVNGFTGQVPTKSELWLTPASTTTDSIDLFTASSDFNATTAWVGYSSTTPTVTWNNRPALLSGTPFTSTTNQTYTLNTSPPYAFAVPRPGDQVNASNGNVMYTYAVRSNNEALRDAVHWYSPKSSTLAGSTTKLPTLNVTLDTAAAIDTTKPGIASQPVVDGYGRVFVNSGNALFELSYADTISFQSPAKVYYSLTQAGRNFGPTTAAPKKYLFPTGNVLLTPNYRVVTADYNPSGQLYLNDFNVNLAGTADRLAYYVDASPGKGTIAQQMLYDYQSGSAYAVTRDSASGTYYVVRANILQ